MYSASLMTYEVYDLNSSLFLELIREILQVEFLKQRADFGKTFLPIAVTGDNYLLEPIADKEINPAFCSVIKAKSKGVDSPFINQENIDNKYIIGILADGLTNLRMISDAAYIILNDMDIKNYIFRYENDDNILVSDSSKYKVFEFSTEFEVSKTMNDKNIIYGYLILQAEIAEVPKFNTHPDIAEVAIDLKMGPNEKNLSLITTY